MGKYNLTNDIINNLMERFKDEGDMTIQELDFNRYKSKKSKMLIIFTDTDYKLEEIIRELKDGRENFGFAYDIAFSFNGEHTIKESYIQKIKSDLKPENIYTEEDQFKIDDILRKSEGVLVPVMTQDIVTKLSLGIQDELVPMLLWRAIWLGKPVMVDFKNIRKPKGIEAKSKLQQNLMENYIKQVSSLGIIEIRKNDYIISMLGKFKNLKIDLEESKEDKVDEVENTEVQLDVPKILTSKDILKIIGNSKKDLRIPSATVITPLAMDTAKEKGIKIVKE